MGSIILSDAPCGYERDEALQREFVDAAERPRVADGWPNPLRGGERELRTDLALEGGGVKGVGLVGAVLVLSEAGCTFHRVAGTSAGAITASLIAGIEQSGRAMTTLADVLQSLDLRKFTPEGRLHEPVDHAGGHVAKLVADAAILTSKEGLYSGDYLESWLRPLPHEQLNIRTFADLRLDADFDPELSVLGDQHYRLVVYVSDLTRSRLVHLPWDYASYGFDPDTQDPVGAVRASMSIPFFFEPVHVEAREAIVEVLSCGARATLTGRSLSTTTA
ncbi:MAG TPA: patatin-like phospholipase family protein [Acidimicrobiales bacterium]|nr:patatin-like phospholipase family protein [Acidimicrobiales bacterium]